MAGPKSAAILVMAGMLVWFAATIVRLENIHYAAELGMCDQFTGTTLYMRQDCLDKIQTRTSWVWHLLYGLKIL